VDKRSRLPELISCPPSRRAWGRAANQRNGRAHVGADLGGLRYSWASPPAPRPGRVGTEAHRPGDRERQRRGQARPEALKRGICGVGAIPVNASVISPVKSHSGRRLVLSKDPRALPRCWTFALGVPSVTWAVLPWAALFFSGSLISLRSGFALLMTLNHSPLNVNQPSVFLSPTAK
jgi:hypothetical protein